MPIYSKSGIPIYGESAYYQPTQLFHSQKEPMRQIIESLVTIVAIVVIAEVVNGIVGYRMVTADLDKTFT